MYKWLGIATAISLLIWAPMHLMLLVPYISDLVYNKTITFGAGNLIGLYSSLIPLGIISLAMYIGDKREANRG